MRPRQQERWHERRPCEEVECAAAFQARDLAKFEGEAGTDQVLLGKHRACIVIWPTD